MLDLRNPDVVTAGLVDGTVFDMAAVAKPGATAFDHPHETAWLGGASIGAKAAGLGNAAPVDVRPRSEDAILVMPDATDMCAARSTSLVITCS